MTQLGWVCHTVALVMRGVELGRPPIVTLPEVVSVVIWVAVLLELWAEWQYQVKVLGAFVLPVILMLGLALPTGLRALVTEPSIRSAWIWVHVVLALLGLAALVLNFAGAVMYLLQERQLKVKRPAGLLPAALARDARSVHLPHAHPRLPVSHRGPAPRVLWANAAWGSVFAFDPVAFLSVAMWVVYAATLSGRALGAWRGRRAAYFAIAGFCTLLLTLGVGVLIQGRHGS